MKLKVSVIGTGYLGATHAACMSSLGFEVIGVDVDSAKIELLTAGRVPFYEPGLEDLLQKEIASGRLTFSTDFSAIADADVHFICVGTPQKPDSLAADLKYVDAALDAVAAICKPGSLVVGKSTVPVGTAARLRERLLKINPKVDLAWNPEFLREGFAVEDTLHPNRLVVGVTNDAAENKLKEVKKSAKAREAQEICGKAIEWGVFLLIARGLRAAYDKRRQLVVDAHVYLGANIQRGAELAIELDVVVVHGPRLTVISCGSSPQRLPLTLKYSEAIQRAEVVGGGEARSITVVQRTQKSRAENQAKVTRSANSLRKAAITDAHPQADRHHIVYLAELFGVDPASRTLVVDVMKAFKDPLNTLDSSKSTKDFSQLSLGRDASLFSGLLYP